MKKIIILISLLFFSFVASAQEKKIVSEDYGVEISYKLTEEKQKKGKTYYYMAVEVKNKNDYDLFYLKPIDDSGLDLTPGFCKIEIRNARKLLGIAPFISAKGEKTRMKVDNVDVWVLRAGKTYRTDKTFKIETGKTPIVVGEYYIQIDKIDKFI